MKHNAKAEAALQAILQAEAEARNAGRDYFKTAPNLMLVEVSRHASRLYDKNSLVTAYMQGYSAARISHDEWMRESEL
jgi:hypothetical protein